MYFSNNSYIQIYIYISYIYMYSVFVQIIFFYKIISKLFHFTFLAICQDDNNNFNLRRNLCFQPGFSIMFRNDHSSQVIYFIWILGSHSLVNFAVCLRGKESITYIKITQNCHVINHVNVISVLLVSGYMYRVHLL